MLPKTLYKRQWRERNREKIRTYNREYNRLWRKKHGYINEEKWRKANKYKIGAEKLLQKAIKRGILKRKPCAICGKLQTDAHHPNYRKPLAVVFLCRLHHVWLHGKGKVKKVIHTKVLDRKPTMDNTFDKERSK